MIYVFLTLIFLITLANLIFTVGISFFLIRMVDSFEVEVSVSEEVEEEEENKSTIEMYDEIVDKLEQESALVDLPN